jgi:hypothetical protein
MAYDLTINAALQDLLEGDASPIAELIEQGHTKNLHTSLSYRPEARAKLARAIRTGNPTKPGEKPQLERNKSQRDWWLCGRVAYWIGRGIDDKWQEHKAESGKTVWHFAASEWPSQRGEGWPDIEGLKASSLEKRWQSALRNKKAWDFMHMANEFTNGVEHELNDVDDPYIFIAEQWNKAAKLGFGDWIVRKDIFIAGLTAQESK